MAIPLFLNNNLMVPHLNTDVPDARISLSTSFNAPPFSQLSLTCRAFKPF